MGEIWWYDDDRKLLAVSTENDREACCSGLRCKLWILQISSNNSADKFPMLSDDDNVDKENLEVEEEVMEEEDPEEEEEVMEEEEPDEEEEMEEDPME